MKAAICTTTGEKVDLHFGKTSTFYIYEIHGPKKELMEKRTTGEAYCPGEVKTEDKDHVYDQDKLQSIYELLIDCDALYTVSIGDTPGRKLKAMGIDVRLCHCPLDLIPTCNGNCNPA